jgi:hypothetical protein
VATVKYRDTDGKSHVKVGIYPFTEPEPGKRPRRPDQTRVIRDLVPRGCTTVSISIRQKKG